MVDIQSEKLLQTVYDDLYAAMPIELREGCQLLRRFAYINDNVRHLNNQQIMEELGLTRVRFNCEGCEKCLRKK